MAIHIEGITVIVRLKSLMNHGADIERFRSELGNRTFAFDGLLVRGSLMSPVDVEDLVARLESWGLIYEVNGEAKDIAVADQLHGLAVPVTWLELFEATLPSRESILCARATDDSSREIVFPAGWTHEKSLYSDLHFVPFSEESRILPLSRDHGIDTVVDLASGALVHRAAPVNEDIARRAKPPLSLATSLQEVFEREEQCIEFVRIKAEHGKGLMPENIVPRKRWWRPSPKRKAVYDRPIKKSVLELAKMYSQYYHIDIISKWVGILYGTPAGLHYSHIWESLLDQRREADRRWLEHNPDGPLPSRRPASSDWLSLLDKELPLYDSEVR